MSFPGRSADKESTCNAGELGLIPELGRSPGEGNSYSLQYSGLEGSMDCLVHGVSKNRTRLSDFHFTSLCKSGLLNRDKLFLSSDVSFASQYSLPWAFQVALVVKNPPANAGDPGSIPGLGRSPGEGNSYSLQYSGLEKSMNCIVHGVTKSQTQLSDFHFTYHS